MQQEPLCCGTFPHGAQSVDPLQFSSAVINLDRKCVAVSVIRQWLVKHCSLKVAHRVLVAGLWKAMMPAVQH